MRIAFYLPGYGHLAALTELLQQEGVVSCTTGPPVTYHYKRDAAGEVVADPVQVVEMFVGVQTCPGWVRMLAHKWGCPAYSMDGDITYIDYTPPSFDGSTYTGGDRKGSFSSPGSGV